MTNEQVAEQLRHIAENIGYESAKHIRSDLNEIAAALEARAAQRDHLATVAALQARINALDARQVPASADDEYAVVWPDGARFVANTLKSAEDYMSGAVPSCAKRGVEPPVIVRYVPKETVPYDPGKVTS